MTWNEETVIYLKVLQYSYGETKKNHETPLTQPRIEPNTPRLLLGWKCGE